MPVETVSTDPEGLTLTAAGVFPVPVARLWAAWADPRQLERFWGPPTWPATFTRHDMQVGGRSVYFMSGPEGEVMFGYWEFQEVEQGARFLVHEGFARPDGTPDPEMPASRMEVTFEATGDGSRVTALYTFPSVEAMEQMLAMGMAEGMTEALAQIDDVLADLRASVLTAELELLDDTHARVTRDVRGSLAQVWRAHHEPALVQKWLLGPDGWTMPVCVVAEEVGDTYRYEWENSADGSRFGFVGELLESESPRREVTTEQMIGMEGPGTRNEMVLTPRPGGRTRIEITITYPSREVRDMVIGTGMVDGMEASYARLEEVALG